MGDPDSGGLPQPVDETDPMVEPDPDATNDPIDSGAPIDGQGSLTDGADGLDILFGAFEFYFNFDRSTTVLVPGGSLQDVYFVRGEFDARGLGSDASGATLSADASFTENGGFFGGEVRELPDTRVSCGLIREGVEIVCTLQLDVVYAFRLSTPTDVQLSTGVIGVCSNTVQRVQCARELDSDAVGSAGLTITRQPTAEEIVLPPRNVGDDLVQLIYPLDPDCSMSISSALDMYGEPNQDSSEDLGTSGSTRTLLWSGIETQVEFQVRALTDSCSIVYRRGGPAIGVPAIVPTRNPGVPRTPVQDVLAAAAGEPSLIQGDQFCQATSRAVELELGSDFDNRLLSISREGAQAFADIYEGLGTTALFSIDPDGDGCELTYGPTTG